MGCGGSSSIDPKLKKDYYQLKDKQKKLQLNRPTNYKEMISQSWQLWLKKIPTYNFKQAFDKKGKKHIVFVGNISAGKSALINTLFGTNLKTGKGQTTHEQTLVFQNNNICIWDSRGFCQEFNLEKQTAAIAYAKTFDHIFVCSRDSVRSLIKPLQVLNVLKVPFSFVRTNCDDDDISINQNQKSVQQELETDRENLSKVSDKYVNIFATSKKGGFDNEKLKKYILNDV